MFGCVLGCWEGVECVLGCWEGLECVLGMLGRIRVCFECVGKD